MMTSFYGRERGGDNFVSKSKIWWYRFYSLKESEKVSEKHGRTKVTRCLVIEILHFEIFQMC